MIGKCSFFLRYLSELVQLLHGSSHLLDLSCFLVPVELQVFFIHFEFGGGDSRNEDFSHYWKLL